MKYLSSILFTVFFFALLIGSASAEIVDLKFKQGVITSWQDFKIENLTAVEILRTKPDEEWGKWNTLVDGWEISVGAAYDAEDTITTVALMLGRQLGVLSDYIPFIENGITDDIEVTVYPAGVYLSDLNSDIQVSGCSGLGVIGFEVKF